MSLVYHERHVSGVCGVLNSLNTASPSEHTAEETNTKQSGITSRPATGISKLSKSQISL